MRQFKDDCILMSLLAFLGALAFYTEHPIVGSFFAIWVGIIILCMLRRLVIHITQGESNDTDTKEGNGS